VQNEHQHSSKNPDVAGISSVSVLFGRLTWFMLGPGALFGILYAIVTHGTGWITGLDAAYFIVVALMVLGRWHEQRSGVATTAEGKPATWDHFRRYVRLLLPTAVVIWILANAVGNHLLKGGQ
jgi:hypothetical protein